MAQRKKTVSPADEAALEAAARAELGREGLVKLATIKPVAARASLVAKLAAAGFEVTKSTVRRPLVEQLKDALAHGALVPLKSLGSHVRGGSAAELKELVSGAVQAGVARRVSRGAVEVLASTEVRVLSAREVRALRDKLVDLGKALDKVTKTPGSSLLATDATSALTEALTVIAERGAPPAATQEDAMAALLEAVDWTRDARSGLSFVPAVVGRLAPRWEAREAITLMLTAAERELLELRPEGGIGRLSPAELSVCPPGPHGTRLSWARRLAGGVP
jgi:hypothetical protein